MTRTIVKLALFFGVCLIFTAYLALTIGNIQLFRHDYRLSAVFDDVTGLLPDDNVKVAGVVVGKVRGVELQQGRARVSFSVRDDVKVPSDSAAAVRWRNLLGQRYVYLFPGSSSTVLGDGGRVKSSRSVIDIGELFNRLGPVVKALDPKEVNTFLDTITAALDGNEQKVRQTIDDLAVVAGGLGQRDVAIGRLIENLDTVTGAINDRDAQIRTVLDNLVVLSRTFSANTDVLNSAVDDVGHLSTELGRLLGNNRSQIDSIVGNLSVLTELVRAKLPEIDETLGALADGARSLFDTSRHGEWLNQVIPCASLAGAVTLNKPCITNATSAGLPAPPGPGAGAAVSPPSAGPEPLPPTRGVQAITELMAPAGPVGGR